MIWGPSLQETPDPIIGLPNTPGINRAIGAGPWPESVTVAQTSMIRRHRKLAMFMEKIDDKQ